MVRRYRARFGAIGCLVVALVLASVNASAGAQDEGDDPPAESPSNPCPGAGLDPVAQVNGETLCTHGGDRLPPPPPEPPGAASPQATPGIACHGNGTSGRRVQAIYARAAGTPDGYASALPLIREHAAEVEAQYNASAEVVGQQRHVRWVTDAGCNLSVLNIELTAAAASGFQSTISQLSARGFNRSDRKYLIWFDNTSTYCGIGTFDSDSTPSTATNDSNNQVGYGRVDRNSGCWGYAEAHELMHTLGAVHAGAPNGTANGHCEDEWDDMCYADGPGVTMQEVCLPRSTFQTLMDCNRDDYFNPAPNPTGYLATHWNTANSGWLAPTSDAPPPPPNDPFADPQALPGSSGTVTGSTAGYSRETGEPNHAGNTGGASRWFTWTAPTSGTMTVDTRGSGFDTLLAVYTGSSLGSLTPVASNDDIDPGTDQDSEVTFEAAGLTTYRIAVDGWNGASGNYTLNWSNTAAPDRVVFDQAAQNVGGTYTAFAGDFNGDDRDDIFWYRAGSGADYLWLANGSGFSSRSVPVSGTYTPIAGDFNGNGVDDIFWYRAGSGADYLWTFNTAAQATSRALPVHGTYRAVAGDFNGNGIDDIFWYAPGATADYMWRFNTSAQATGLAFTVGGTFTPFAADFDGDDIDDIFWYAAGTASDLVWYFTAAANVSASIPETVDGTYLPAAGDFDGNGLADVLWYGPGSANDSLWFDDGSGTGFEVHDLSVAGNYRPVPGRFNSDPLTDLFMYQAGVAADSLWTARIP